jgi:hypothetical protein
MSDPTAPTDATSFDGAEPPYDGAENPSEAVLFTDDFESGAFKSAENGVHFGGTTRPVSVTTDHPRDGSYSAAFFFEGGVDEPRPQLHYDFDEYLQDVWVQYDIYFPTNWQPAHMDPRAGVTCCHAKGPIMLWSNDYFSTPANLGSFEQWFVPDWPPATVSYHWAGSYQFVDEDSGGVSQYCRFPNPETELGRWTNIIARIKFAGTSTSSDGVYQLWKDGIPCLDKHDKPNYLRNGTIGVNHMYILGAADMGFVEDTTIYIDNLLISTGPIAWR